MGNAIWLLVALPTWFFAVIAKPFAAGLLSAIPFFGILCLGAGAVLGAVRRQWQLLLFLLPVGLSELVVGTAGALRDVFAAMVPNLICFSCSASNWC